MSDNPEGIGLLAVANAAPRGRAVLYSYYPIDTAEEVALLKLIEASDLHVDVVDRRVGTPFDHPSWNEAIEAARSSRATVILLPNDSSLGPVSYSGLLEDVLPKLETEKLRMRAVPPGIFDSADPKFVGAVTWAAESVVRFRESKRKKKYAPCMCGHRVTKPGGEGHNLIAGEIGPCRKTSCGCSIYRPKDLRLMGKGR
jgi:hypothetical protein